MIVNNVSWEKEVTENIDAMVLRMYRGGPVSVDDLWGAVPYPELFEESLDMMMAIGLAKTVS